MCTAKESNIYAVITRRRIDTLHFSFHHIGQTFKRFKAIPRKPVGFFFLFKQLLERRIDSSASNSFQVFAMKIANLIKCSRREKKNNNNLKKQKLVSTYFPKAANPFKYTYWKHFHAIEIKTKVIGENLNESRCVETIEIDLIKFGVPESELQLFPRDPQIFRFFQSSKKPVVYEYIVKISTRVCADLRLVSLLTFTHTVVLRFFGSVHFYCRI